MYAMLRDIKHAHNSDGSMQKKSKSSVFCAFAKKRLTLFHHFPDQAWDVSPKGTHSCINV